MTKPLLLGRTLVFAGMVLLAYNLRTAVTGLAPLIPIIRQSLPLDTVAVSLIGALAPICFAVASLTTPRITRRIGLTASVFLGLTLIVVGHLLRSTAMEWTLLAAGSLIALLGTGMGNVIMPPLIKKYFPDHVGVMTSIYMTVVVLSATIPPLIAVPVADATSWRIALAQWGFTGIVAAIPWILVAKRDHRTATAERSEHSGSPASPAPTPPRLPLRKSSTAWAIGVTFAVGSFTSYAMFAWMPVILIDIAQVDLAQAGALVALYTLLGIPSALIIPIVAGRMKRVDLLMHSATALFTIGFLGLLIAPSYAPWLWIAVLGSGPLVFPLAVVLVNLRSETQHTSLELSGFAQSISYICASVGPVFLGLTFEITGGWTFGLIGLAIVSTASSFAAFIIRRGKSVEADLAGRY